MMSPLWHGQFYRNNRKTGRIEKANRVVDGTWEEFFFSFRKTKRNSRCRRCGWPLGYNLWHRLIRGSRYHQKCAILEGYSI